MAVRLVLLCEGDMNDKQALAIIAVIIRSYRGISDDGADADMERAIAEAREYLKAGYRAKPIQLDDL